MLKNTIEKEWFKSIFGKYFGKKTKSLDEIINDNLKKEAPKEKKCGYIIFDIIQNELFEPTLSTLLEYSENKKFFVDDIYGTIVIMNIVEKRFFKNDEDMDEYFKEFIKNIPGNVLENTRFIYGMENAIVGTFGSNNRWVAMVLLKDYYQKILKINKLNYGEKLEIKG
jgi:hypothetical protein